MNSRPTRQTQRMLDVLDARWAVGEAVKRRSKLLVKFACLAAACGIAVAVSAPVENAYASDETTDGMTETIVAVDEGAASAESALPVEEAMSPMDDVIVSDTESVELSDDTAAEAESEAEGDSDSLQGIGDEGFLDGEDAIGVVDGDAELTPPPYF